MKNSYVLGLFIIVCLLESCSTPMSKEAYLEKYDAFIEDVSKNHNTYNEKDWEKATAKYDKFTGEWNNKFKEDFTIKEKTRLTGYQVKFNYYRTLEKATDKVKQLFESLNVNKIKEQIQFYIDNNMQDDLRQLIDGAEKVGEEAEKAVKKILKDLDVDVKEFDDKYEV